VNNTNERRAYVERLADYLGERYGLESASILNRVNRRYVFALSRHLIAYRLFKQHWTTTEIAELMGLDHSTVSYATARVARQLKTDPELVDDYHGMPAFGVLSFTEPDLVELYQQLAKALGVAKFYAEKIDLRMESERVPRRFARLEAVR
jgi:hypothetical protein